MKILLLLIFLSQMPAVDYYAEMYDVDPDVVRVILWIESYDDPDAVSYSGAMGYMQIMPGTAEYIANCTDMIAEQILNSPEQNIRAGTWYFSLWYHRFLREGRENPLDLALASYYGGPKHVIDCDCVPPFTQHYVDKVKGVLGIKEEIDSVICVDGQEKCLREIDNNGS